MAGGFIDLKSPRVKSPNDRPQAGRKSKQEQDGKRREQEIFQERPKKTEPEEDNNFKSADSPQFQTAAVRHLLPRGEGGEAVPPERAMCFRPAPTGLVINHRWTRIKSEGRNPAARG
jgi:hypothetical protein